MKETCWRPADCEGSNPNAGIWVLAPNWERPGCWPGGAAWKGWRCCCCCCCGRYCSCSCCCCWPCSWYALSSFTCMEVSWCWPCCSCCCWCFIASYCDTACFTPGMVLPEGVSMARMRSSAELIVWSRSASGPSYSISTWSSSLRCAYWGVASMATSSAPPGSRMLPLPRMERRRPVSSWSCLSVAPFCPSSRPRLSPIDVLCGMKILTPVLHSPAISLLELTTLAIWPCWAAEAAKAQSEAEASCSPPPPCSDSHCACPPPCAACP
mmetsp:Transcript_11162/g.22409  ORF Transcript_11162/g.22409 Transcript_11162/m.22409 type:complete len:267 (-) Transcript_11162:906-1706(-)